MATTRHTRTVRLALASALAATCFGAASCGRVDRLQGILLISIDSLRADHLGCYGYGRPTSPRLDALAREGTFFHTAVSTTSWTLPAHMSLLTGLLPEAHAVQKMSQRLDPKRACLAEILREAGFRTGAVVSSPLLDKTFGFDRGFESYENFASLSPVMGSGEGVAGGPGDPSHADTSGARVVDAATAWLRAHGKEPFFLFVHLWDVHYDYDPPPPYENAP
jgi:arylsulfatase A-like enzyme